MASKDSTASTTEAPLAIPRFSPAKLRAALARWKLRVPGRSLEELTGPGARRLGVTLRTIYNWQNGDTVPDANELLALCAITETPLADLSTVE